MFCGVVRGDGDGKLFIPVLRLVLINQHSNDIYQCLIVPFGLSVGLWSVRRCSSLVYSVQLADLLQQLGFEIRSFIGVHHEGLTKHVHPVVDKHFGDSMSFLIR